ncbi:MAG: RNase adapter RapZ [Clostridia bacterium]|nr:RNase adapter RapZ [Clostridia bacterium]
MDLVIVTGMSGAGKSTAANALEDIGYYCVDNIPPAMIRVMAEFSATNSEISKFAIVTDTRSKAMFNEAYAVLDELKKQYGVKILFLDSSNESLTRRYKQTRRSHPLSIDDPKLTTDEAIVKEREIMRSVRGISDYIIDTSLLSMALLKEKISTLFLSDANKSMRIECRSFGFKHGAVTDADLLMDVRCLVNPYYVENLRELTGLTKEIQDFVMEQEESKEFVKRMFDFIDYAMPLYVAEGKTRLVIAFGCTGGKHRSVTLAELLCAHLKKKGYNTDVNHRDINKK